MCLLTYVAPNAMPNLSRLRDGCEANPDGFGYAIVAGSEILVGKGLMYESVLLEFNELRREHPEGPALFHSRIGTHGLNDLDNCHPFYVAKDQRTVLAHNGVLPAVVQPKKGDPRSDTRIAAEYWIPRHMGRLSKVGVRRSVERWMGRFNKIVVLTVDPRYRQSAYILNEDAGHWADDDCWYSNSSYMWGGGWQWIKSYTAKLDETTPAILGPPKKEQVCVVCSAIGWTGAYCPWCRSCQGCESDRDECVCEDSDPSAFYDEYRDSLKLPDDGHGACPACQSYYACDCTEQDFLEAQAKEQMAQFAVAMSKED